MKFRPFIHNKDEMKLPFINKSKDTLALLSDFLGKEGSLMQVFNLKIDWKKYSFQTFLDSQNKRALDCINKFKEGEWFNDAKAYIDDSPKMKELLQKVQSFINKEELVSIKDSIQLFYNYVSDIVMGRYKTYNAVSLTLIVAALIYLITPTDIVWDMLLGGFIDDGVILSWTLNEVRHELEIYKSEKAQLA